MGNIKKVPLRKCIGCNEMKNKKEMMRVCTTSLPISSNALIPK